MTFEDEEFIGQPRVETIKKGSGSSDHAMMFQVKGHEDLFRMVAVPYEEEVVVTPEPSKKRFGLFKSKESEPEVRAVRKVEVLSGFTLERAGTITGAGATISVGRNPDKRVNQIVIPEEVRRASREHMKVGVRGENGKNGVFFEVNATNKTVCTRLESRMLLGDQKIVLGGKDEATKDSKYSPPIELEENTQLELQMGGIQLTMKKTDQGAEVQYKTVSEGKIRTLPMRDRERKKGTEPDVLVVGREPELRVGNEKELKIPYDVVGLSKSHARIIYHKGLVVVEDTSTYGTEITVSKVN